MGEDVARKAAEVASSALARLAKAARSPIGRKALVSTGVLLPVSAAYLVLVEPILTSAIQALPMLSSGPEGIPAWLSWVKASIGTIPSGLTSFWSMDWAAPAAVPGYLLLALFVFVCVAPSFKSKVPHNDIIDAQPPSAGSNEYGNSRWLRTEKEIARDLGFRRTTIEHIADGEGGLYMGMFGRHVLLATADEHAMVLAPTRTGKTRQFLLPTIACLGLSGECMCMFDPKGELYGLTSDFLRERGYKVNRIDFSDPSRGNRWNPLYRAIKAYMGDGTDGSKTISDMLKKSDALIKEISSLTKAAKKHSEKEGDLSEAKSRLNELELELTSRLEVAETEVKRVTSLIIPRNPEKEGNAAFFNDGAESLIQMTLHYLASSPVCPEQAKTIHTASKLIAEVCKPCKLTKTRGDGKVFAPLIEEVHRLHPRHPAYAAMLNVDGSDNLGDFVTTAKGRLAPFTSTSVARMMCDTDYPPDRLADEKTATFIIVPNDDDTYKQTAQMYFRQVYMMLVQRQDVLGGRLPIRMNIIGEEFKQLPPFDAIDEKLSLCAGMGIRWTLVLQSLTQLQSAYEREDAATIMENCAIKVCLRAGDEEMGRYVEGLCGQYTISISSSSSSKAPRGIMDDRVNQSQSLGMRKRCLASEAIRWNPDQGVMVLKSRCMPACVQLPKLETTPFEHMLGLGDVEHNKAKTKTARERAEHDERSMVPTWDIGQCRDDLVGKFYTGDEIKDLREKRIKKLLGFSMERQGLAPEKKDGGQRPKHAKKQKGSEADAKARSCI